MRRYRLSAVRFGLLLFALSICGSTSPVFAQDEEPSEQTAEPPSFLVIANVANPTESLSAKSLSRMFLKKTKRWDKDTWDENVKIVPFDLTEKSPIRKDFTRQVHDKSTGAIKSYWQREIFSGRDSSPEEVETDEEMMELVANEKGAVGYVSGTAELPDTLKVIRIAED